MQQELQPPGGSHALFPTIQLCGEWLRDSGFKAGHTINIPCEDGKTIIYKSEPQRFDVK